MNKMLTVAVAASMVTPMALTSVMADEPSKSTTVTYEVQQGYEWSVPTEIKFTADSDSVTTSGTTGATQDVQVTKNVIPNGKNLVISVTNTDFKIATTDGASLNYKVSVKGTDGQFTELKNGNLNVLSVAAGTNTGSATLKFDLTKDSVEKAGNYSGTVSYSAAVK